MTQWWEVCKSFLVLEIRFELMDSLLLKKSDVARDRRQLFR